MRLLSVHRTKITGRTDEIKLKKTLCAQWDVEVVGTNKQVENQQESVALVSAVVGTNIKRKIKPQ